MTTRHATRIITALGAAACLAAGAIAADTCHVALRPTDPLWNRPKDTNSVAAIVGCAGSALDSQNNAVPYRIVKIRTPVAEFLSLTVTSLEPPASGFDPFIGVYCSSFNASGPLSNLVTLDDDSAGWPNAAVPVGRNITLTPNTDYFLVVSAYSSAPGAGTPFGRVRITLGGAAVFSQAPAGCCKADFNQDGQVAVQDIFDFLNAWLAVAPATDIDGVNGVQVADIFAFLGAWFQGC
ncbi:MAG TPA: GC-type dockerin domain-anchored protein [Phycisphaerales bacterium]|nr:GC-type dockerin domain-anchored protein [Phycisphaerales bacterium]